MWVWVFHCCSPGLAGILTLKPLCSFFLYFPAGKEKPKPKRAVDLFDEDDEDGDIFSDKYSVPTPAQSKKEAVEEQAKPPEKKVKINVQVSHKWIIHI